MILSTAEMAALAQDFGPKADEGQVFIASNARVRDGAGWKTSEGLVGPIPARISFQLNNVQGEKEVAGKPAGSHRYMVELPLPTQLSETDNILVAGVPWLVSSVYLTGTRVIPSAPNGCVYFALNRGTTGTVEPTWTTAKGDVIVDGGVTWQCAGPYMELNIDEIDAVESYSITVNVFCSGST